MESPWNSGWLVSVTTQCWQLLFLWLCANYQGSQVVPVIKNPPANAGDVRNVGLIPRSGRSPGGGHGNSLQYSCLENPQGERSLVSYSPWGR